MNIREFIKLVASGAQPVVEFGPGIEDTESYAEPHMRAVVRYVGSREEHSVELAFDFEPFDDYNKAFESSNYRDKQTGRHDKTARQVGCYKPQDTIYFGYDDKLPHVFHLVQDARVALFTRYSESGSTLAYTAWLEDELLKAQQP
jgi:hypothetical protein